MWRPGSKPHAVGRYVWSLVAAVVRHDIMSLAAVITFYAFFSLFPFLLLVIYTASTIVPQLDVQNVDVQRVLMHLIGPFVPALQAEKVIQQNISNLAVVGRQIGLFSALTLTWSAMSGFLAVQQAMDVIWEREQRSFIARRIISFFMVMVLLVIMLFSALVTTIYPWLAHHVQPAGWWAWLTWLQGWSKVLFPASLLISFLIFYRYLPSRRAAWPFVVPGALAATLLLDLGRKLFVWYANHLVRYYLIYGTLTAVMLLLLWIYVGSIVMLFGAEVSAALERMVQADGDDADVSG
ncbi:YihY/virulence factor BrkB family protein [Alicyclobacillus pomorum]|jgi:membrane protein|uniref:YihY/virulence factor BrkB family protein n=1 Tax=Alicyclobacillus pomorum TaxID=204470 RepID=UPI0003F85CCC|nr:YihY/virulence factor BrkB family protein [Alicyclobacillus pomorum]